MMRDPVVPYVVLEDGLGIVVKMSSGRTYRLPFGEELERIDAFLRQMHLSGTIKKRCRDVDALLDVRFMYHKEV